MSDPNNSLAEALAAIIKPIVREAVREAMNLMTPAATQSVTDKSFLTVKQSAEFSGLSVSMIRLSIRRRELRAQRVGRRMLVKRPDLERFLQSNSIAVMQIDP